eukprot:TRINITY_DN33753_c0_g1_i1.p1 TRINITY_DN33753_c0_g1~~TRINITY_DN33753_c0_g1_i1.p1  ORF type:complete len:233 (+),score=61.93 TRINITY_DN33753_c0_g1_i1:99-797(+)
MALLVFVDRTGAERVGVEVSPDATVADLKAAYGAATGADVGSARLCFGGGTFPDAAQLCDIGVSAEAVVELAAHLVRALRVWPEVIPNHTEGQPFRWTVSSVEPYDTGGQLMQLPSDAARKSSASENWGPESMLNHDPSVHLPTGPAVGGYWRGNAPSMEACYVQIDFDSPVALSKVVVRQRKRSPADMQYPADSAVLALSGDGEEFTRHSVAEVDKGTYSLPITFPISGAP